jgi:predicted 3-demethylubiquinone-9 3-methyltransferase (glyoxalase superfamily)
VPFHFQLCGKVHSATGFAGFGPRFCGWCKDKWGLSWQITPRVLTEAYTDSDRAAAKRAFDGMMEMKKIDVAKIEAARRD